jgi:hypothetical protein
MFTKSLKSILAVAAIAGGAAFSIAGSAQAGNDFGVYIGGGHSGIYIGNGGHYKQQIRRHGPRHRGFCGPRRAVKKAWRMGVNRPHIQRVNGRKIVVTGYSHGHRAKVVFKRDSKRCRVIRTRGLY